MTLLRDASTKLVHNNCRTRSPTVIIVNTKCFYIATIKFVETFYNVTEPGIVEVGIELMGNITFNTTFLIDVDFATATGIKF